MVVAFAAIYLIWGSTYLAIRFAIETLPPFAMAAFRFTVAGGILYAIARPRTERPTRLNWFSAGVVGTLLLAGGNGGVVWAEQWVPSGLAALIIATVPLWMVLFDWLFAGGPRPSKALMAGLVWGLCGVGLLMSSTEVGAQSREGLLGGLVVLGASVSWAAGSIYARKAPLPRSPFLATAMQMIMGGLVLALVAAIAGEGGQLHFLCVLDEVHVGARLSDRVWCTDRLHGVHLAPRREHAGSRLHLRVCKSCGSRPPRLGAGQ